jgi:predicted RNase H-like nuclease (RuvC/YqgF family)
MSKIIHLCADIRGLLENNTQLRQNLVLLYADAIELSRKHLLELISTIEALQQENKTIKSELRKWEEPFDRERFEETKKQSHAESLAAKQVYITALEHALKHMQKQLAPLQGKAVLVMDMPEGCGECLLCVSNVVSSKIEDDELHCTYLDDMCPDSTGRHPGCPLRIVGGENK